MNDRIKPLSLPFTKDLQETMNKIFPSILPSPNLYRIVAKNEELFTGLVDNKFIGKTGVFHRQRLAASLKEKIILKTCIKIEKQYNDIKIDKSHVNNFSNHFGFSTKTPLSYLYTLAQRIQIDIMLRKQFTIPIPGLVHIENYLKQHSEYNFNIPFEIIANAVVEYKDTGSLIPIFSIDIYQKGIKIVSCTSLNIAKRKTKMHKKKKVEMESEMEPYDFQETWNLKPVLSKKYADISGDKNPIHTSSFFCKNVWF